MRAVVIVANGWNAGWLGCYGNEWTSTPNLDRLAAECVVFDQHFATHPAAGSSTLTTGCYDLPLPGAGGKVPSERPNLFHTLRKYGVRTVKVRDSVSESDTRSPDEWDYEIEVPRAQKSSRGEALFALVAEQLDRLRDVNEWLLWIETDRLLPPWQVSPDFFEEYARDMILGDEEKVEPLPWSNPPDGPVALTGDERERLQGTFAAVVSEWDAELGEWFDLFRELKLDESALWMVTAGHGISLEEHDWAGPSCERLHEEFVHIPLLLRLPSAEQAGRRIPVPSESIDLLPTLFEAFARGLPSEVQGCSLLPLTRGVSTNHRETICQGLRIGTRCEWAMRTPEWACLLSSDAAFPPQLFRKPEDRWEVNDVRQQHLEWAEHMESVLREFVQATTRTPFEPPALRDFHEVIKDSSLQMENNDEHGTTGERDDG